MASPVKRHPRRRASLLAALFLGPLVLVNITVTSGPGLASIIYSFTDWDGVRPASFVGLANYKSLISDPQVAQALGHNIAWMAFFLVVPMTLALLGAFLLSRLRRGRAVFRVLFFIPYVLATVVCAAIWRQVLSPVGGITTVLGSWGLPGMADANPLGDPSTSLLSVALVNNWQWWGFLLAVFLAAMQGVDPALYEASRLDGATAWQEFFHITLPSIRPTFMFLGLMTVIWSFLVFDFIYVLTQGGPAGSTEVLGTLLYRTAFSEYRAGYASAIAVLLTGLSAGVVAIYLALRKKLEWDI